MIKYFIFLIFSAFNVYNACAQSPNWIWAKSAGGFYKEFSRNICSDIYGDLIIAGIFATPFITFDTDTLVNTNALTSDIYVVKYDSAGNVIWAISEGGTTQDDVLGICTDLNGNIFITGIFNGPSITFDTTTLMSSGATDIFIAKYDVSGNFVWAQSAGGNLDDYGLSISSDQSGNLLVTGSFQSNSIIFDSTILTNINTGEEDIFVVKYDPAGNVLWAQAAGGTYKDKSSSICSDGNDNVFITGFFNSPSISFGTTNLINTGLNDLFVVKLNSSGNFIWAKSGDGIADDLGSDISTDGSGNVIMTGSFSSPFLTFGTNILTNAYAFSGDIVIIKYDASGNILWAKSSGGQHTDVGLAIAIEGNGNILVSGYFLSTSINFGSITLNNVNFGTSDMFIVKYESSGNPIWALSKGGSYYEIDTDISIDLNGNVLIAGSFSSPSLTFGATTLTNSGYSDIYIAKLDSNFSTGIEEPYSSLDSIFIFPNPTYGSFTIKLPETIDEIIIRSLTGQIVYKSNSNENNITININDSGIYFMQITSENRSITKKIIVYGQ